MNKPEKGNRKCIWCGGRVFSRIFWNEATHSEEKYCAMASIEGYKCCTCGRKLVPNQLVKLNEPLREVPVGVKHD